MSLKLSKRILRISGIITIIISILGLGSGIFMLVIKNNPSLASEVVSNVGDSLLSGNIGAAIISSLVALFEGISCYCAGRNGKLASIACVITSIGLLGSCMDILFMFLKNDLVKDQLINAGIALLLNIINFIAAIRIAKENAFSFAISVEAKEATSFAIFGNSSVSFSSFITARL